MTSYRDIITGPRWARIATFIKDAAFMYSLKLVIDVDKGWLRETVRFEVEGSEDRVDLFKKELHLAMDDYQRRTART